MNKNKGVRKRKYFKPSIKKPPIKKPPIKKPSTGSIIKISFELIIALLIIGSAFMFTIRLPPFIYDLSLFGIVGIILSIVGIIILIIKRKKKK
tara:strand:+ start:125 stop:403 length:279 start_codon:yes stop_codon:yes gene_type:complete